MEITELDVGEDEGFKEKEADTGELKENLIETEGLKENNLEEHEEHEEHEEQDTRPVQEILKECIQKTQGELDTYKEACKKYEQLLKRIKNIKTYTININGNQKSLSDFIDECASTSFLQIKEGKQMNFGELLLTGLTSP